MQEIGTTVVNKKVQPSFLSLVGLNFIFLFLKCCCINLVDETAPISFVLMCKFSFNIAVQLGADKLLARLLRFARSVAGLNIGESPWEMLVACEVIFV